MVSQIRKSSAAIGLFLEFSKELPPRRNKRKITGTRRERLLLETNKATNLYDCLEEVDRRALNLNVIGRVAVTVATQTTRRAAVGGGHGHHGLWGRVCVCVCEYV